MTEPDVALDYPEREVKAVLAVLIELGQVLGAYRDKFVVVGGAVPWLLLPNARPQHIGTLDIGLDLDPDALSDGEYATLVETLERRGYERDQEGLRPFQLRRWVQLDNGSPIAVLVDLLIPRGVRTTKNRPPLLTNMRVQGASGAGIALTHNVRHRIEGQMPDGRNNSVEVLVASIPALLVMKGYALAGRDKKKDCYDIYFSIRNYEGGPEQLAEHSEELLNDSVAQIGYQYIADKFRTEDDFGPQTVRRFLAESDALGEMTPEQAQTDAFRQVKAWLNALDLA